MSLRKLHEEKELELNLAHPGKLEAKKCKEMY